MTAKRLEVGPQTVAVHESGGTGPAIFLLHGNSASSRSFQRQLAGPLGEKYRVVAMDLPGHGNSAPAADPVSVYTLPGYAGIVLGVVEQLGLGKAVFVGWSLGGHVFLEAADRLPDAAGFVIFGTPLLGFPPDMDEAFLPNPAAAAAFKADLSDDEIEAYIGACFQPGEASIPRFFYEDARRTDRQARAVLAASIAPGGYKDELEVVTNLQQPLAILHGDQEQLINGAYLARLNAPSLWREAVQIIPGAGHTPQWEAAEHFNGLLEAFVQETA